MELRQIATVSLQKIPSDVLTDRLHKQIKKLLSEYPLPNVKQTVTYWPLFIPWRRTMIVAPQEWWYPSRLGRSKDGNLQVEIHVHWQRTDGKDFDSTGYSKIQDHAETVRTDVKIFPLTVQQAAFVGCKVLLTTYSNHHNLCWGTMEDVMELKRDFPLYQQDSPQH
jgi:hypothetical protein